MAKTEKPSEPKEVRTPKPAKKSAAKPKKTKNELLWEEQARLLKRRIRAARKKGYDVELELVKPAQIRKRDIEQLKSLKRNRIIKGVDLKQVKIRPPKPEALPKLEPEEEVKRDTGIPQERSSRSEGAASEGAASEGAVPEGPAPEGPAPEEQEEEPEPLEPRKFFDTESGRTVEEGDPDLYVRDKEGNIIHDSQGNPLIKNKYILISSEPMPEIDFDELMIDAMRDRYAQGAGIADLRDPAWGAKNKAVMQFIDKMRDKYGASALRRAFEQGAEEGYEINQNFLYLATVEDVAFMLTRIAGILGPEAINEIQDIITTLMTWGEDNENWEEIE